VALPLVAKWFKTPKGCHVRRVELLPGNEAEIGYDCGDGGRGSFPLPRSEGSGTYPSMIVKGVRSIHVPGTSVSGQGARLGFELSPRHVTCAKSSSASELTCHVRTPGGGVLAGHKRRRKSRR
jgi:hypothetical protein